MRYEDRIAISTPEGLDLELTLAGAGSRMLAALLDQLLLSVALVAVFVVLVVPFGDSSGLFVGLYILVAFVLQFGYRALFETFGSGRTPGKRIVGLRVVREGGAPITFRDAMIRSVLFIVDGPLTLNTGGLIAILASKRNQRIGDMAAGTIVVRERVVVPVAADAAPSVDASEAAEWDVTGITDADIGTVRRFLERRSTLDSVVRARLARDIAGKLRPRVVGAPDDFGAERFLELLVAAKSSRS